MKISPLFLLCLLGVITLKGAVLQVGERQQYTTIKAAVNAAFPHDTLCIHAGRYTENTILLSKPLTIKGQGETILDAEGQQKELIIIAADSVVVEGL